MAASAECDPMKFRSGMLCDFIEGESLLGPVLAGERWAEDLYIDTVCALQSITREQLATLGLELAEGKRPKMFWKQPMDISRPIHIRWRMRCMPD
jgi:hypothetical protein